MRHTPSRWIALAALTLAAGCSSLNLFRDIAVESRATAGVDYGSFKTFRFLHSERKIVRGDDVKVTPTPEPLNVYLEGLVAQGLAPHGLVPIEAKTKVKADLDVRLTVVAKLAASSTAASADPEPDLSILEVAITRTSDNREVWWGSTQGEVWEEADEATTKQRIEHAVGNLLARYPN
ncbi:MAG: DUF4136 domain-containing protein [Deltaproteobacteria bacterium]|jgi:hypothetical protein|nr:DUF4136 domain-containing protein [Deltaproteobacteria bacterium]